MANNQIQIKRSETTATPTTLANGELAWSGNSNVLYIGDFTDGVVPIGGARVPGTLTANQALVANSTSGIDRVIVANAIVTTLTANGSTGTAGQVLTSNGTVSYWSSPSSSSFTIAGDSGSDVVSTGQTLTFASANGLTTAVTDNQVAFSVDTGSTLTVNSSGVHVNSALSITDLTLSGNLTVTGTLTTIDTTNLVVEDPLIKLANGNVATDALDIGFFGVYDTSGSQDLYAGMFRDATDNTFKLFVDSQVEPTTTVDTAGAGYTQGTLQAFLKSGGLVSNSSAVTLTSNSTLNVNMTANTLTLTSALVGTSGGTGLASYTAEDVLVANTSNGFRKLALGTTGQVLQSNGTALVYAHLDGGTF